ncbi:MAG: hypothetical protein V4717_01520 [Bacteroidota bacterium]
MKRADQHPVTIPAQHGGYIDPLFDKTGEEGIDMPSEKELSEIVQTPVMGALPVDNPGSTRVNTTWQSSAGDEAHIDLSKEESGDNKSEIIATGSGPDPEQIDDAN